MTLSPDDKGPPFKTMPFDRKRLLSDPYRYSGLEQLSQQPKCAIRPAVKDR